MRELRTLNTYFYKYRKPLLLGVFCIAISNIAGIFIPVFIREAIDDAVLHASLVSISNVLPNAMLYGIIGFVVLIIVASIIKGVFTYLMRQYIIKTSRKIEFDIKNSLYNKFQLLPAEFYQSNYTGDLMAHIGEDVSNVRMYVGPVVMYAANLVFAFITVIYQMLSVNATMTFFALLPIPFLSFIIFKLSQRINTFTAKSQAELSGISTLAQETFAGIRVIKSFAAETEFIQNLNTKSVNYKHVNLKLAIVNALFFPLMQLLMGASSLIVLWLGSKHALSGTFTIGNFAEFVVYLNMLIWPVASLGWTTALAQKAAASMKRINVLLFQKTEDLNNGIPFEFKSSITIENLSLTYYNKSKPALGNINVTVNKGSSLGIIGKTGSGKTTLIKCIIRELQHQGSVFIDANPNTEIQLLDYRKSISYIPQEVYLFSDTIYNNIAMGKSNATHDEVFKAAQLAELTKDLDQLPNGLQTMLGERGVSISGGQKQRVALARSILSNAQVYILDDCLSAVDSETEHKILNNLKSFFVNKTFIISSHRVVSVSLAAQIITLSNGEIIEKGTANELLLNNNYFSKQQFLQSNG